MFSDLIGGITYSNGGIVDVEHAGFDATLVIFMHYLRIQ